MNKIFNTCAKLLGNGRYINYDGSAYGTKGLKHLLSKPTAKASAIGTIGVVGLNLAAQGSLDITTEKMLDVMMDCVWDNMIAFGYLSYVLNPHSTKKIQQSTIDTHGTDLNRQQLSLKDILSLEKEIKTTKIVCPLVIGVELLLSGPLNLGTVIFCTHFANSGITAKKILDGDWVLCGKPPKQTAKEEKTSPIFGGKTVPTP